MTTTYIILLGIVAIVILIEVNMFGLVKKKFRKGV